MPAVSTARTDIDPGCNKLWREAHRDTLVTYTPSRTAEGGAKVM
jgi:hypothetical protein